MENENGEDLVEPAYEFLLDKKTKDFFAKVDYYLRSGVHIQREFPKPEEIFRFIDRNYESLESYYKNIFQVILCKRNESWNRYYYIDFEEDNRGKISNDYRNYLKTEHLIIGILFFKIYKLDANLEIDSINDFVKLVLTEYDEEKHGLLKLIADSKKERSTDFTEEKLIDEINRAFNEFGQLGWISWVDEKRERFNCLPSFERLRSMYQDQIINIDELIMRMEDAK